MSSSLRTINSYILTVNIFISVIRPTNFIMSNVYNLTFIIYIFLISIIKSFFKFFEFLIKFFVRKFREIILYNRSINIRYSRSNSITNRTESITSNTETFKSKALHSIFLELSLVKNIKWTSILSLNLLNRVSKFIYGSIIVTCNIIKVRTRKILFKAIRMTHDFKHNIYNLIITSISSIVIHRITISGIKKFFLRHKTINLC